MSVQRAGRRDVVCATDSINGVVILNDVVLSAQQQGSAYRFGLLPGICDRLDFAALTSCQIALKAPTFSARFLEVAQ